MLSPEAAGPFMASASFAVAAAEVVVLDTPPWIPSCEATCSSGYRAETGRGRAPCAFVFAWFTCWIVFFRCCSRGRTSRRFAELGGVFCGVRGEGQDTGAAGECDAAAASIVTGETRASEERYMTAPSTKKGRKGKRIKK